MPPKEGSMLNSENAVATVAVKDLDVARSFYEGKLGLKAESSREQEAVTFVTGDSRLIVYRSQFAGTNKATSVTWPVGDVESTVKALKAKGVAFEHYDMPQAVRQGDVHVAGGNKAAWFKDPDGNIIAVVSR